MRLALVTFSWIILEKMYYIETSPWTIKILVVATTVLAILQDVQEIENNGKRR